MLFVLPTPLVLSELDSALPCSEEEWSADTAEKWWTLRTGNAPPTPSFQEAFTQLFEDSCDRKVLYSECGSYIMISAILSAIFDAHRLSYLPSGTVNFEKFDVALNNWQRLWLAEPKSLCTGRSTPIGALAFNASAVYRAASVMRVRDYTRYSFLLVACLIQNYVADPLQRRKDMLRPNLGNGERRESGTRARNDSSSRLCVCIHSNSSEIGRQIRYADGGSDVESRPAIL